MTGPVLLLRNRTIERPGSSGFCFIFSNDKEPSQEWYHSEAPMDIGTDIRRAR